MIQNRPHAAWLYVRVIFVSVLVAVLLAEWILSSQSAGRLSIPFYNRLYPYVMFRPHENASFVSHDAQLTSNIMSHNTRVVHHYTNEDAFRVPSPDYELPRKKPAGQWRLAMLGSSSVQLGTTYEDTLPGSLRAALEGRLEGRDVEVINAGIQSCVSRQSICHLLFTLVDYKPDVVILYDGFNDLMLPLNYESRPNFPYNFQTIEAAWENYRADHSTPLWRLLLDRSNLYRAVRNRLSEQDEEKPGLYVGPNAKSAQQVVDDPAWVERHVAAYLSNWQKLIELSTSYGYRPVCVLQPTAVLDPDYGPKVTAEGYQLEESVARAWVEALAVLYAEASRQVQKLQSTYPEAVIVDFSVTLLPAEKHFWDVVHVYDETNKLLAEELAQQLPPPNEGS